ncbi:MAG: DUF4293 domain-containing protein [Ferruginibacter sp.]
MIQRIQSIWLLSVVACAVLSFFLPFAYSAEGGMLVGLTAQSHWYLFLLTLAIGLASLIVIFLYHDRKLQLTICMYTCLATFGLLAIYVLKTMNFPKIGPSLFCLLVAAMPIFIIMSMRAIRNDMKLIEESDRLR